MSPDFETATRLVPHADNRFAANIPDGWQMAKGAFGGVIVGLLGRAIILSEKDGTRRLRSLSADLVAPAMTGPAEVKVTTLRHGATMSFLDAQLLQDGAVVARASASLAAARAIPPSNITNLPAPELPPWGDMMVVPVAPPMGPVFAQHYEYRTAGPFPFMGGSEALSLGYVRERVRPAAIDEAAIVGLLDSWWPTVFAVSAMPRAATTVGYTMQLLIDPKTLPPEEPLAFRARAVSAHDNFFVEMRELWAGGRPVALNQQTFALLT